MIVYNVLEEIRIIMYLFALGIFIPSSYDTLKIVDFKNKIMTFIIKLVFAVLIIILCYYFLFKLNEGYVPQYGIIIILIGMSLYFFLLRRKFVKIILKIKRTIVIIIQKILIIFKPFKIFKTTFLLLKEKSKKLYIKILYKRKKM